MGSSYWYPPESGNSTDVPNRNGERARRSLGRRRGLDHMSPSGSA